MGHMSAITEKISRGQLILKQIDEIKNRQILTDRDYRKLAHLKAEMISLYPPLRFLWIDAVPVIDLWAELAKLEKEQEE